MENNVKKLLSDAARRAVGVAEGAKDAFAGASRMVGEKADVAKLSLELVLLQSERDELFTQMGRTFYLMNTGCWSNPAETAEQCIERLLGEVSEKEMLTDELEDRINELRGETECPVCHRLCDTEAAFCSGCGAKLHAQDLK